MALDILVLQNEERRADHGRQEKTMRSNRHRPAQPGSRSKYLVQITGVDFVDVVLLLRCMCVIFGIDNKHFATSSEHDVALHYR